MFIQTEKTPNPNSLKFLPGEVLLPKGTADFRDEDSAERSPIAIKLFGIDGVEGVFLGHDFISITKSDDKDWLVLKPLILGQIMDHLTAKQPILLDEPSKTSSSPKVAIDLDDELTKQILELLDTRIRPAVARDGGDIEFQGFEDGTVYVKMQGACAGCPSSTLTLKAGIENMLRHYIPEVQEVQQV